jgi:23S rRNA (pseudouridine1915-N3)-methyltransferase
MKIALLQTGKTTEKYIAEGVEEYFRRIKKYTGFEIITVPAVRNTRNMPVQEQKNREGKRILQVISKGDYIILLDEAGKDMGTVEFAGLVREKLLHQGGRILFIIGGPWGFSEEISKISDMKLSLSRMTFSHQMVRLLFVEQLYRAFTIMKGEPYHHE